MKPAMTRADRTWTAVLAECALDRARPVLANLLPRPFARVNLTQALEATGLVPERGMGFAEVLEPALRKALGEEAEPVFQALARLPWGAEEAPASAFWRALFRDLHGANRPDLPPEAAAFFAAFLDVYRGRSEPAPQDPAWLQDVAEGTHDFRDLIALARAQRALPLAALDRSIFARFGWNDDGEVPGMTGLMDAAALMRTRLAWAAVSPLFNAEAQAAIEAAARRVIEADRAAALATLEADARRLGQPAERLAQVLYPPREVPALGRLLDEAA